MSRFSRIEFFEPYPSISRWETSIFAPKPLFFVEDDDDLFYGLDLFKPSPNPCELIDTVTDLIQIEKTTPFCSSYKRIRRRVGSELYLQSLSDRVSALELSFDRLLNARSCGGDRKYTWTAEFNSPEKNGFDRKYKWMAEIKEGKAKKKKEEKVVEKNYKWTAEIKGKGDEDPILRTYTWKVSSGGASEGSGAVKEKKKEKCKKELGRTRVVEIEEATEAADHGAVVLRQVLNFLNDIFDTLLKALSDPSDEVVLLVLEVHACIAKDLQHFRHLVVFLVHNFRDDNSLLEKRGALIIRRLCVLLDAERVYRELSTILEGEADLDFASIMVQALNLILLTSSELAGLRSLLKQSLVNPIGKDLFVSLYASWCHSPMAIISLCLLAQTYQHASSVIQSLVEEDINVKFLVQLDKLVRLLETPIFAYLRLQLLEPGRYIWLLKALYGLLMLLPQQSAAFKILRTRLKTVPPYSFSGEPMKRTSSGNAYSQILHPMPSGSQVIEDGDVNHDANVHSGINFASRLQQFENMQRQHRMHSKSSQAQSRNSSTSYSSSKEVERPEEARRPMPSSELNKPPSRSSRRGPGQLQV